MLMFGRGVSERFGGKLLLLELGIGSHATFGVTAAQVKHAVVQSMESGQGDELKFVTHSSKLTLKFSYRCAVEFLFPVKRRRTIVGQHFIRELGSDVFGKLFSFNQIGLRCFTPNHIG